VGTRWEQERESEVRTDKMGWVRRKREREE
jgi:hypothetical protein